MMPAIAQKTAPSGWIEDAPEDRSGSTPKTRPPNSGGASQKSSAGGTPALPGSASHALRGNASPSRDPASSALPSPAADSTRQPGDKRPLQAVISHVEQLPPLPSGLRVGAQFDERMLRAGTDNLDWYKIPDWLAGKWSRNEETIISTYYYDTQQQNNEPHTIAETEYADFGSQYDRAHNVWHCRLATKGIADCGSYLSVAFIRTQEPLLVSDAKVAIRDLFVELEVNKETGVITKSEQAESITRYMPVQDGVMKTMMSVKIFGEDGSPVRLQKNLAYDKRMAPFAPLDKYKNTDIKQSFLNFLKTNSLVDLIPFGQ